VQSTDEGLAPRVERASAVLDAEMFGAVMSSVPLRTLPDCSRLLGVGEFCAPGVNPRTLARKLKGGLTWPFEVGDTGLDPMTSTV
jgi:hypothetical protein